MVAIHPEFVVDDKNAKKAVMLPLAEWQQVIEELEELDDIRAFDEVKSLPSDPVPFEAIVKSMERGKPV